MSTVFGAGPRRFQIQFKIQIKQNSNIRLAPHIDPHKTKIG
jgi:hypothetical protein